MDEFLKAVRGCPNEAGNITVWEFPPNRGNQKVVYRIDGPKWNVEH